MNRQVQAYSSSGILALRSRTTGLALRDGRALEGAQTEWSAITADIDFPKTAQGPWTPVVVRDSPGFATMVGPS